jgi:hypothetical protein
MRNRYLITGAVILLLILLPYLFAQFITGPDTIFGGFLFNPLDGNSYLAKIQQGWAGSWTFTLPYSAQTNGNAYLFLFYLFLGHVARWLGLSTLVIFHLARLCCAAVFLFALQNFFSAIFPDRPRVAYWAFLFSALGSGLGWVAALLGGFTSDFWVAEAYPFLSMYANPHFPLGLAILLWFLTLNFRSVSKRDFVLLPIAGLLLGIIFPFGIVVAGVVTIGMTAYDFFTRQAIGWQAALAFLLPGGAIILYQFIIIRTDPILAVWDAQNQTPSPPLWDFLVSFLPWIALAIWGIVLTIHKRNRPTALLAGWMLLGALLIYFPFNLQRRFLLGYLIPVAGLAAYGLAEIKPRRRRLLEIGAICVTMPTLWIILAGGLLSVKNAEPTLVIHRTEMNAFAYLAENGQAGDLVLAAPETGMFLPAYTGQRVIYGHPFETVNAQQEEKAVEAFFAGPITEEALAWARRRGVRWILWGPRENLLGQSPEELPEDLLLVYEQGNLKLFKLQDVP